MYYSNLKILDLKKHVLPIIYLNYLKGRDVINQHICLFLAAEQLDAKKQRELFYRMSTALGYDEQKMITLSAIYSHYGLFEDKPLTQNDINALKRLSPCTNCAALRKKPMYKNMAFWEEACPLCIYSENYCNSREKDEMLVLKYLMMPGSRYEYYQIMSENAFISKQRLCNDYALGKQPVLPFNLYIYQYLENTPFLEQDKDNFLDGLLRFISTKLDVLFDIEQYREYFLTHFNTILRIDDKTITEDIYNNAANQLRVLYSYSPPVLNIQPVASGSPGQKPLRKRRRHSNAKNDTSLSPNGTLFDMIETFSPESDSTSSETDKKEAPMEYIDNITCMKPAVEDVTKPSENTIPDSPIFFDMQPDTSPAEPNCHEFFQEDIDVSTIPDTYILAMEAETFHETVSENDVEGSTGDIPPYMCNQEPNAHNGEQKHDDMESEETLPFVDPGMPDLDEIRAMISQTPENIVTVSDKNLKETNDANCNIPDSNHSKSTKTYYNPIENSYNSSVHYVNQTFSSIIDLFATTEFSDTFDDNIHMVSYSNRFTFSVEVQRNVRISIEPVFFHERIGILLYLAAQNTFWFYDTELYSTEMLYNLLSAPHITVMTMHPLAVMYFMKTELEKEGILYALDIMYWVLTKKEPDVAEIINSYTQPVANENHDFLFYTMPLYYDCFISLYDALKQSDLLSDCARLLRVYSLLSHCIDMSGIFQRSSIFLTSDKYLHYNFSFSWADQLIKKGQIFRIEMPDIVMDNGFTPDSFLTDICLCFFGLHHTSRTHVHLLSITDKAVYIFYEGEHSDALRFYDSIMARFQKCYQKRYNNTLESRSTYVIYQ